MMNGSNLPPDCFYEKPPKSEAYKMIGKFFKPLLERFSIDILKIHEGIQLEANPEILIDIFLRFDERLVYFHIFHGGMKPSQHKQLSLILFWIIKLRPLHVIYSDKKFSEETRKLDATINEDFCIYLLVSFLEGFYQNLKLPNNYLKELKYSLRFRNLTKESLYLLLDQFYCMIEG